jgi:GT2 family glycosyltransferase
MGQPLVSVIIVVHNNLRDLRDCLSSILRADYPHLEIIAVDSASTDGSPDLIRREFPTVKLLEVPVNVGFSEGGNRAARLAKGDFIFFLNPDTVTPPHTISTLAARMGRDPRLAVLAPKMLFLQEPKVINSVGLQSNRIFYSCDRGFLEYDRGQYDEEAHVIGACGGAMFVRKAVIDKIGLFDRRYFMYYEDLDFGICSWLAGYKVLYMPEAVVYHRMRASGRSEVLNEYVDHKNRLRTLLKNCSPATLLRVLPRSLVFDLACIANHLRLGRYSAAGLRVKALLWNLAMLPDTLAWRSRVNRVRRKSDHVFLSLLGPDSGYPRVNVPSPPYSPLYASTLDPAKLRSRIEPGRPDADQLGLGWYGPEMWGETPIRWSNNYGIAFLGKPWPGPGELTIRYISPLDVVGKLLVNDTYLCDFSGQAHQWETIQQRIDGDTAVIKVTLLLDKTFNLRMDFGARDDRILGIAVSSMVISRAKFVQFGPAKGNVNIGAGKNNRGEPRCSSKFTIF